MAQAGGDVAPSWANRRIWGDVGRLGMREKPADCSRRETWPGWACGKSMRIVVVRFRRSTVSFHIYIHPYVHSIQKYLINLSSPSVHEYILSLFQIISLLSFSRYIYFTMHLNLILSYTPTPLLRFCLNR